MKWKRMFYQFIIGISIVVLTSPSSIPLLNILIGVAMWVYGWIRYDKVMEGYRNE